MKPSAERSEFDAYSGRGYSAGMEDGFKRLMGESSQIFLEHKAAWLLHLLAANQPLWAGQKLLDFGCGTGAFLLALQSFGFTAHLEGCDVSRNMIAQAEGLSFPGPRPLLHLVLPGTLNFPAESFDIITAVCVFHHIEPSQRPSIVAGMWRVLKPGGRIYVFEHNPWNPLTRMIVRRCLIDQNAKLLTEGELSRLLIASEFQKPQTASILFFPPRWKKLWPLEKHLSWLPVGGQYVTWAQKSRAPLLDKSSTCSR